MGKANGKTEVRNAAIDLEHELPPAENSNEESQAGSGSQTSVGTIANGTSEMSAELEFAPAKSAPRRLLPDTPLRPR